MSALIFFIYSIYSTVVKLKGLVDFPDNDIWILGMLKFGLGIYSLVITGVLCSSLHHYYSYMNIVIYAECLYMFNGIYWTYVHTYELDMNWSMGNIKFEK